MTRRLKSGIALGVFISGVIGIAIWSWVLVDPNFTLIRHADWTAFRERAVAIGYHQRPLSSLIYVAIVMGMFVGSWILRRTYRGTITWIAVCVGIIAGIFSYPALSHDLFNYIFDARIVTHYGANPYLSRALDFPYDPMIRFMHWVHRTYPYGPSYLVFSLIPSYLGFGVFGLTFFLFKGMHVLLYVVSTWCLEKMNKTAALVYLTSPLVIVEGLVNSHNDFVAVGLAIIGIYLMSRRKRVIALVTFLLSGLVKYITLPVVLLTHSHPHQGLTVGNRSSGIHIRIYPWMIVTALITGAVLYLARVQEIQPWYFLNLYVIVYFAPSLIRKLDIFFVGLILSYYPYVYGGEWGQGGDVSTKHTIIVAFACVNMLYLAMRVIVRRINH